MVEDVLAVLTNEFVLVCNGCSKVTRSFVNLDEKLLMTDRPHDFGKIGWK